MRTVGLVCILALSGIIAAFLWADLLPRRPELPAYQHSEGPSAEYEAGGSSCRPRALAFIRDNRKATRERERCAEAAEKYRLQRDDLVQQTRAADADQAQAITAYDTARMALWGTVGGFLTLIAAGLAAFYARGAAVAARDSLGHEKTRTAAELRPWVKVEVRPTKFEAEEAWMKIIYEVTFTNIGKTTAEDFVFKINAEFCRLDHETVLAKCAEWDAVPIGRSSLMPGEARSFGGLSSRAKQSMPWEGSAQHRNVAFVVVASAFYRSPLDADWHRTDRSFTIGRSEKGFNAGVFLAEDMFGSDIGLLMVKPFRSGDTT